MECSSTLHYLLDIIQTDDLSSMSRLAALSVLNKLFIADKDGTVMAKCFKADITSSLLTALDLGLSTTCDPADAVYVMVAMETMSRLSKLTIGQIQPLVNTVVIKALLGYLDVSSSFYRFNSNIKDVLTRLCQNKQLIGKVKAVAMGSEPLEYIHTHTRNKLRSHARLPDSIKLCELFDTEGEEDLSITECLIKNGLAIEGSFLGEVIRDESDEWQDVVVTQVLDGGMFWGQVGEKCIKEVNKIQQQLNHDTVLVRKSVPKKGDIVMVKGDVAGTSCYLRAQIMSVDVHMVETFAVDYGYYLKVPAADVYCLPENLGVAIIPRKISFCTVSGIQPQPYDESLVQMAVCVLTNLCKQTFTTGEIIREQGGIAMIDKLLSKELSTGLTTQLINLMCNLANNSRLRKQLKDTDIVPSLLDIVKRYVKEIKVKKKTSLTADSEVRLVLIRSIMCLTNLMVANAEARETFYTNQGIDVMIKLLKVMGRKQDVMYKMLTCLFRVFIGRARLKPGPLNLPAVDKPPVQMFVSMPQEEDTFSHKRERIVRTKTREPEIQDRREVQDTRTHTQYDSDSDNEHRTEEGLREQLDRGITTSDYRTTGRYIQGSLQRIWDDDCHEICLQKKVNKISTSSISQIACGMLNTGHGGTIYYGIDKESRVIGLELNRDEKDRFRLGVDMMMTNKIIPVLLHSQFDFQAQPVYSPETKLAIPDLYVIEIRVKSSRGSIYTTTDGLCYYRFGAETSPISRQELRHLVAIDEEAHYIDELKRLLQQKEKLMSTLNMDT